MITAFYAAVLALVFLVLTGAVIAGRLNKQIALGTNNDKDMTKRVRAHANFAEFVPFALLLLMMAEMQAAPLWAVHMAGIMLVFGRVFHARGINHAHSAHWHRRFGALLTYIVILAAALWNLWVFGARMLAG